MNLFLATFQIKDSPYMEESVLHEAIETRIIMANGFLEAEQKLRARIEKDDQYGCSVSIENLDMTEAIQ